MSVYLNKYRALRT